MEVCDRANGMTEEERVIISSHIESEFGIKMPVNKKPLLTGRLSKRLRILKLGSYREYFDYIHTPSGKMNEYHHFADLISTHETSFFRERSHFDFMISTALPDLIGKGIGIDREMHILSAACSSGEEAYSIACTIEDFVLSNGIKNFRYKIIGTDMSQKVVEAAARGVFNEDRIKPVSTDMIYRYFMKSRDRNVRLVRVVPEVRKKMEFFVMNLMDKVYPFEDDFDIIFCRNVLIYFDRGIQESVSLKLCRHIFKQGYLFIGHSESLFGFELPISAVVPTVYKKI